MYRSPSQAVKRLAATLFPLLLVACQPAVDQVEVPGWRHLTSADIRQIEDEHLAQDPTTPRRVTAVSADFNGDGKTDRVAFLVSEDNAQFAPYFFDGAGAAPIALEPGEDRSRLWRYSLAPLPPAIAYELCTEKADATSCEHEKAFKSTAIAVYEVDHGGSVHLWNGQSFVQRTMK